MLATLYFFFLWWLFGDEIRAWIVETYAQAHLEAEKRMVRHETTVDVDDDCASEISSGYVK